ncbi:MAG: translation initiation factor IF-5A [Nanoarchaeota archaeon]|nr:translation initiation factor IF-5A [Nanoarchaeota archaeon]MBU4300261.1 translation initiation factor IF-5A [Nanoarchaeota archaeon]MBU4452525.1 translation initiation factor IF-5A [Nanoarchaeota archaeon]MCG2723230.1 translation initiation factor IF-5A [archaeon]
MGDEPIEGQQIEAKDCKKGVFIMVEGIPCRVTNLQIAKTGKHGHSKARVDCEGLFDGKKRVFIQPGGAKVLSPNVDKRVGQILSIEGENAQIMDSKTYETFYAKILDEIKSTVKDGQECDYWVVAGQNVVMAVR